MIIKLLMDSLGLSRKIARISMATVIAIAAGGAYLSVKNFFVSNERARVEAKGSKIRAKAEKAASAADVDKTLRKNCRDC